MSSGNSIIETPNVNDGASVVSLLGDWKHAALKSVPQLLAIGIPFTIGVLLLPPALAIISLGAASFIFGGIALRGGITLYKVYSAKLENARIKRKAAIEAKKAEAVPTIELEAKDYSRAGVIDTARKSLEFGDSALKPLTGANANFKMKKRIEAIVDRMSTLLEEIVSGNVETVMADQFLVRQIPLFRQVMNQYLENRQRKLVANAAPADIKTMDNEVEQFLDRVSRFMDVMTKKVFEDDTRKLSVDMSVFDDIINDIITNDETRGVQDARG